MLPENQLAVWSFSAFAARTLFRNIEKNIVLECIPNMSVKNKKFEQHIFFVDLVHYSARLNNIFTLGQSRKKIETSVRDNWIK